MTVLAKSVEADAPAYPFDAGTPRSGLHPFYHRLLDEAPVSRVMMPFGMPAWLVVRYSDVNRVLTDDEVFSLHEANRLIPEFESFDEMLIGMVPADHRRVRSFINKAFTPRRTEALRPAIAERVDSLLAAVTSDAGPAELVEGLGRPLTLGTVLDLLGIPEERASHITELSQLLLAVPQGSAGDLQPQIMGTLGRLGAMFYEIVMARKVGPGDDLISDLVVQNEKAKEAGVPHMTDREFIGTLILLIMAGDMPTTSLLSQVILDLVTSPGHVEFVRGGPAQRATAMREFARFYPVGSDDGRPRVATRDVKLSGVLIRKGDIVVAGKDAANFDPAKFDAPRELDLSRSPNPMSSFGRGPHVCVGAGLALTMGEEVCRALSDAKRFPNLRLAVPVDDLEWIKGLSVRGPLTVPVLWR